MTLTSACIAFTFYTYKMPTNRILTTYERLAATYTITKPFMIQKRGIPRWK